jgi:eukaryotic-like serine/threonine-protein kinase
VSQVTWNGNPNYAMKKPHFGNAMTDGDEAKFLKELHNQAQLQHPNCVRVYAVCMEKNNVFIITDWMHGGSLYERLARARGRAQVRAGASSGLGLSAQTRLQIARNMCDALQYMHGKGMVHGDIKSLNVLLGKDGSAKLCDFGLNTMELSVTTAATSDTVGAVSWSAPEIILCQGQRHTPQTDIYALGIVMWELLTCALPFEGLEIPQVIEQLVGNQRPPIPDPIPPGFPAAYVTLMTRCWDKDPANRPSAAEAHQCMIDLDLRTQRNQPV